MKTLLMLAALLFATGLLQAQDSSSVAQIQLNLDKYHKQSSAGLRLFGVGCVIGAATLIGIEPLYESGDVCKGLYGLAAVCGAAGIIVHMDASRYLKRASMVSVSPNSISLKF
jgi:hypothetical protein